MTQLVLRQTLAVLALSAAVAVSPAFAQDGFARQDQLEELQADLSSISTRVRTSIDQTILSAQELENFEGDERTNQAFAILDSIEAETQEVIDKIKITSPFMSALDDARSTVLVLLRKHERDPASPARDARIAALTASLGSIDEQTQRVHDAEQLLTELLVEHARKRSELIKDDEVLKVQVFVDNLSSLTQGLEQMANVLSEISESIVDVPSEVSLASE